MADDSPAVEAGYCTVPPPMSSRIDLQELVTREREQVEWKRDVADVHKVVETITAFANDLANLGGGYVVCGAEETKDEHGFPRVELVGLDAARLLEVEKRVMALCRDYVDPSLAPLVEEHPLADGARRVLIFVVPASPHAHVFRQKSDNGKYYVRVSRDTIEARNGLLRQLLSKKGVVEPWDRRACAGATVADIDLLILRDTLQRMRAFDPARGVEEYLSADRPLHALVPPLLVRAPLDPEPKPRNFAMLLFGRDVQRWIPGAVSLFSIYPGRDRSDAHAERHEIVGGLIEQARRLNELLDIQAYTAFDKNDPHAPNAVRYPQRALQEAMVNALAHRDYELVDPTRVTVFADRIEIRSPGSLVPGIDLTQLQQGAAPPRWRNQALAWFLNRLQLAQAEGQGIPTILRTMREEGCPPPSFQADEVSVQCLLPAHPRHALIKEQQDIEHDLSLGDTGRAHQRVQRLIAQDPYNFRSVRLFVEVQRALGDTAPVAAFARDHEVDFARFSALALVHMADAIVLDPRLGAADRDLARRMLNAASSARFDEREARRVAISLLTLKDDRAALDFIERSLRENPSWTASAAMLQLRGRTELQLAKRCMQTGRDRGLPIETRRRAWNDCRSHLERAEHDLRAALTHAPEAVVRDHAEDDLRYLAKLREQAKPPTRPSRGR